MDSYTVEVRIQGSDISPEWVTSRLCVSPNAVQKRLMGPEGPEVLIWSFDGRESGKGQPSWTSLENGIRGVLSLVYPNIIGLKNARPDLEVYWWCGVFFDGFSASTHFSIDLLKLMAGLEIPIFIENYPGEDTGGGSE